MSLTKFKFSSMMSGGSSLEESQVISDKTENPFGIISIYEEFRSEFNEKSKEENQEEEKNKLGTVSFDTKNNVAKISGSFIKRNNMADHIQISDPRNNVALYEICRSIIQWSLDEHGAECIIFEARLDSVPFTITPIVGFDANHSGMQVREKLELMVETLWNMKMCSK